MKKIFASLIALYSAFAFSATTVPIQLITPIAANTAVVNATGSTATPTAFAMPSCSTSASALNWTTSTGFTCNTAVNAAQLGGATFASPGPIGATTPGAIAATTIVMTSTFTPNQTAGIVGTTTNNNANAGSVGEFITSSVTSVSMTSGTGNNVTSISLTAGDWDVEGNVILTGAATTVITSLQVGINTVSVTQPATPQYAFDNGFTLSANSNKSLYAPYTRLSLSTTTTVFLVCNPVFNTSTATAAGFISARRRR